MENNQIVAHKKRKRNKEILLALLGILTLTIGTAVGIILIKRNQEIREKAATPAGTVRVFLSPENKTIKTGESFDVNILLDTAGNYISAITISLTYPYNTAQPPIKVENIQINSKLIVENSWSFPIKTFQTSNGLAEVRIGGINSSTTGYKTNGEEILATLTLKGYEEGSINLTFEPTATKATNKTTGEDILLTPSSTGKYTVVSSATDTVSTPTPTTTTTSNQETNPTPTATTTSTNPTPTNTASTQSTSPTPTNLTSPTSTTSSLSNTSSTSSQSTSSESSSSTTSSPMPLPETGISIPTLFGIGVGALFILIALAPLL